MKNFKFTRNLFSLIIKNNLKIYGNTYELMESAFPSYIHKNPFIRFLFWKRLEYVYNYICERNSKTLNILDFGFGSGVMTFALAREGYKLTAVENENKPVGYVKETICFPDNITWLYGDIKDMDLASNQFDFIIALDVLEHILDVSEMICCFKKLLKEDGEILVTGPSENIFYKAGRRLAGKLFTGEYHKTNIFKIINEFKIIFEVTILQKLYFPINLFIIFVAKVKRK